MRMSGSEVEIIMARQELTKMSMAEKIGISRNRLYTALNSKNLAPATVGRIAKVLGVDVEEILEDEQKHQFRVQAYYDPISSGFTAMTEEQFQANEALRKEVKPGEAEPFEKYQMLEWYETLAEAAVSPFFSWFWY